MQTMDDYILEGGGEPHSRLGVIPAYITISILQSLSDLDSNLPKCFDQTMSSRLDSAFLTKQPLVVILAVKDELSLPQLSDLFVIRDALAAE